MQIAIAITCVNYADFLRLTLPHTVPQFQQITVITSPDDLETKHIAGEAGAECYLTSAWKRNGVPFNKASALNEWLDSIDVRNPDQWILTLDADILLPPNLRTFFDKLDPRGLYSMPRRMCETQSKWNDFVAGHRKWETFTINIPPVINGLVWGGRPTNNPAALSGYFQLWNPLFSSGLKRFPEMPTAKGYDVDFALSFPAAMRRFLFPADVLHLGPSKVNWAGRCSEAWTNANPLLQSMCRMQSLPSFQHVT